MYAIRSYYGDLPNRVQGDHQVRSAMGEKGVHVDEIRPAERIKHGKAGRYGRVEIPGGPVSHGDEVSLLEGPPAIVKKFCTSNPCRLAFIGGQDASYNFV